MSEQLIDRNPEAYEALVLYRAAMDERDTARAEAERLRGERDAAYTALTAAKAILDNEDARTDARMGVINAVLEHAVQVREAEGG